GWVKHAGLRRNPPHPAFGRPLPGGARWNQPGLPTAGCGTGHSSPSPQRGEGWGEGGRAVALSEESPALFPFGTCSPTRISPRGRKIISILRIMAVGIGSGRVAANRRTAIPQETKGFALTHRLQSNGLHPPGIESAGRSSSALSGRNAAGDASQRDL